MEETRLSANVNGAQQHNRQYVMSDTQKYSKRSPITINMTHGLG